MGKLQVHGKKQARLKIPRAAPEPEEKVTWSPPLLSDWLESVDVNKAWIIEHILPEDGLVLISGQQKRAFKTWFAFLLALCVSQGKKVGLLNPKRKGPVLIIEEEGARAQTKSRFLMLCATLGLKTSDLTNIHFAHRERVKLDDEEWRKKIVDLVRRVEPVLVIYDALSYAHTGDENSHQDMTKVIDTMQSVRASGTTMVMLVHLDKQRGENPRSDIDTQPRGSSIIVNAYDTHLALRRYKMSAAHVDLYARHRDDAERRYSITWDVKEPSALDPNSGYAKFSMLEVIEGEKANDDLIERCKAILESESGTSWSARRLRELWEVSEKTSKMIRDNLIEAEFLEQNGATWQRPKLAKVHPI